jgi:hypothetical protein
LECGQQHDEFKLVQFATLASLLPFVRERWDRRETPAGQTGETVSDLATLTARSQGVIASALDATWQRGDAAHNSDIGANACTMSGKTLMDIIRALMKGQQARRAPLDGWPKGPVRCG